MMALRACVEGEVVMTAALLTPVDFEVVVVTTAASLTPVDFEVVVMMMMTASSSTAVELEEEVVVVVVVMVLNVVMYSRLPDVESGAPGRGLPRRRPHPGMGHPHGPNASSEPLNGCAVQFPLKLSTM
jgi:hypothetical protein